MMLLHDYERIMKDAYVDLATSAISKNKTVISSETLRCRECGRFGVTLRKCSDGQYICNDCLRKEK